MYAMYGNYKHSAETYNMANLIQMEVRHYYTERRKRWAVEYVLHIGGDLIADSQSGINTLIEGLADAYSENGKSWTLFHDDGTKTRHRLDNDDENALSDVQVESRSWPSGDAAEYATGRRFYIVLKQMVSAAEAEIVAFQESIKITGGGGFRYAPVSAYNGIPTVQLVWSYTPYTITQEGSTVGIHGWPVLNVPYPVYPAFEDQTKRIMIYSPPHFSGRIYTNYAIHWQYTMFVPTLVGPITPSLPIY